VNVKDGAEPEEAESVLDPACCPSVHVPTVATPLASVVTVGVETSPPPLNTEKETVAPARGAPF
jgi:hypothetical protein